MTNPIGKMMPRESASISSKNGEHVTNDSKAEVIFNALLLEILALERAKSELWTKRGVFGEWPLGMDECYNTLYERAKLALVALCDYEKQQRIKIINLTQQLKDARPAILPYI